MTAQPVTVIGERINPGFRSVEPFFAGRDFAGLQALARRQADAGAAWLNINASQYEQRDPGLMVDLVRAIQQVVDTPLSLDSPDPQVQQACLQAYDAARARGRKPIINSLTEARWSMAGLLERHPARIMVMASERLQDGEPVRNTTAAEVHETARRLVRRLAAEHGVARDDIIIDIAISNLAADTEGLVPVAIESVRLIGADPELAGVHLCGGLSNISQDLPARTRAGVMLKDAIENAFLTLTVPAGLDMVIGTPWKPYRLLPADDPLLQEFREILLCPRREALRRIIRLQRS